MKKTTCDFCSTEVEKSPEINQDFGKLMTWDYISSIVGTSPPSAYLPKFSTVTINKSELHLCQNCTEELLSFIHNRIQNPSRRKNSNGTS